MIDNLTEATRLLNATQLMLLGKDNQPISDLYYALQIAVDAIEELQERREEDRWVSTKERMPEKDGVYFVAIQYVAKYEEGSPIHTIELLASYDTKYGQWSSPDNVIAWRPLPEPYESEAENEANN